MLKLPVFKIIPLFESYHIEQIGNERISFSAYHKLNKSMKRFKKSSSIPLKCIFIQTETKKTPVFIKKSGDDHIFVTGPLRLKKAKTEKDLEYWKKKLFDILKLNDLGKSLEEILFPGIIGKSLPEKTQNLLIKARGYAIGTKRTWSGKEYKKVSGGPTGKGKWVRTYSETESRGAKQAIRNVRKKIMEAETMEELLEIIKQNSARFKDDQGKMLPVVKEFISAIRGTEAGAKIKPEKPIPEPVKEVKSTTLGYFKIDEEEAEELVNNLNNKNISSVDFYLNTEDDETEFLAEVDRPDFTEHIRINPFEYLRATDEEIKEMLSLIDVTQKEISEIQPIQEDEEKQELSDEMEKVLFDKLDKIIETLGGKEKIKTSLLTARKKEDEGEGSQIDIITGEVTNRKSDVMISGLSKQTGLTPEEILKYIGIGIRGKDKKKRKSRADIELGQKVKEDLDEAYDPTLDPTSSEYRFKDTGYIEGSRKELASDQIKSAKKDGRTVKLWSDTKETKEIIQN